MKKILAILLAVLMTVSCMSLTAFAADDLIEDGGKYYTQKTILATSTTYPDDGNAHVIDVADTVGSFATGETYKFRITGSSDDGKFRFWIGHHNNMCDPLAVIDRGPGAFDIIVSVTVTGNNADALHCVAFKSISWGATLDGLTITSVSLLEEYVAPVETEGGDTTGYIINGDGTHAVIINGAVITSAHEYNDDGVCVFCHHVKPVVEEEAPEVAPEETPDVEIEAPVESETEETDEDNVVVDDNPTTGVAFGAIALTLAVCTLIASKRR